MHLSIFPLSVAYFLSPSKAEYQIYCLFPPLDASITRHEVGVVSRRCALLVVDICKGYSCMILLLEIEEPYHWIWDIITSISDLLLWLLFYILYQAGRREVGFSFGEHLSA